ncbi:MAG: DUF3299 domain-containing protein, partial [Ectothiorhodospiraceae bacterium]|nr:DUF3299 domain-containing protein [Ectothiorhodospiraceae bacterium]
MSFQKLFIVALLLIISGSATARDFSEKPEPIPPEYQAMVPKTPKGAVAWTTFEKVTMHYTLVKGSYEYEVEFAPEARALDGKTVKVMGYILPLEQGERIGRFLLSALPPHCPFCLPAGPARLIEVFAEDPVRYSAEPVLIEGSLKLLP